MDPSRTKIVSKVLAEVAQPETIDVPDGEDPQRFLQDLCGDQVRNELGTSVVTIDDRTVTQIRVTPCLRTRKDVQAIVQKDDTFESIALRLGMRPPGRDRLKVISHKGKPTTRRVDPEKIQPGDKVLAPVVPAWTRFRAKTAQVPSREAMIEKLGDALGCKESNRELCVAQKGVILSPDFITGKITIPNWFSSKRLASRPALPTSLPPRAVDDHSFDPPGCSLGAASAGEIDPPAGGSRDATELDSPTPATFPRSAYSGGSAQILGERSQVPTAMQPLPPVGAEAEATPASPASAALPVDSARSMPRVATIVRSDGNAADDSASGARAPAVATQTHFRVAADQWPFDRTLVAAALSEAAKDPAVQPTDVGVADSGLTDIKGAPLHSECFTSNFLDDPSDSDDNDGNEIVNDTIGAGMVRPGQLGFSNDVSLCDIGAPSFSDWGIDQRRAASHGAIVTSIVSGRYLRDFSIDAAKILPRAIFFRVASRVCSPNDEPGCTVQAAIEAFEYFRNRDTRVVNLSYSAHGDHGIGLATSLRASLAIDDIFLVLPAGNDSSLVNQEDTCPACLGNRKSYLGIPESVFVVGAATRNLEREPSSNFGEPSVFLYAPGQPYGAVDIAGESVDVRDASTSYAAPLVSSAIALLRSFGIDSHSKIRARLQASTWPLFDNNGAEIPGVGVLDFTRIAASRMHAIETYSMNGGTIEFRTHIGKVVGGLENLRRCNGRLTESIVQSLRIRPAEDGVSNVFALQRIKKRTAPEFREEPYSCRLTGSLQLEGLDHVVTSIELSEISRVLFRAVL